MSITGHSSPHTPNILCVACVCTCFTCLFDRNHFSTRSELAVDSCFGMFSIFRSELGLIKDFPTQYEVEDPAATFPVTVRDVRSRSIKSTGFVRKTLKSVPEPASEREPRLNEKTRVL